MLADDVAQRIRQMRDRIDLAPFGKFSLFVKVCRQDLADLFVARIVHIQKAEILFPRQIVDRTDDEIITQRIQQLFRRGDIVCCLAQLDAGKDQQLSHECGTRLGRLEIRLPRPAVELALLVNIHLHMVGERQRAQTRPHGALAHIHRRVVSVKGIVGVRMHVQDLLIVHCFHAPSGPTR